jgi:hypothetical protein
VAEGREELVRSKYFVTELVRLTPRESYQPAAEKCQLWICLEGRGIIGGEAFQAGEVWLLPDQGEQPVTVAETASRFLRTWVPAS